MRRVERLSPPHAANITAAATPTVSALPCNEWRAVVYLYSILDAAFVASTCAFAPSSNFRPLADRGRWLASAASRGERDPGEEGPPRLCFASASNGRMR